MSIDPNTLPILRFGSRGPAVEAAKTGVNHGNGEKANTTRFFGPFFGPRVKRFQAAHHLTADGVIGPATWRAILPHLTPAAQLLLRQLPPSVLLMCNPIPRNAERYAMCQGLHPTAGIPGNWAVDLCVAPKTPVLACEAGTVTKLSGHSPTQDTWDTQGVFGWSVHFETPHGYHYFVTHLGSRTVQVGDHVVAGTRLGTVGDQAFRPDHVHYGLTSPKGEKDAKARIMAVANAPRI